MADRHSSSSESPRPVRAERVDTEAITMSPQSTTSARPTRTRTQHSSGEDDERGLETRDSKGEHRGLHKVATAASALLRPLDFTDRPAPPPQALDSTSSSDHEKEADEISPEELTAYQYSDGRVKIARPKMGDRLETYHPEDLRDIRRKNSLLKTDVEKAVEGEAGLKPNDEGKIVLTQRAGYLATAYGFSTRKKWLTLVFTGFIQISMNFNTSVYPNAVPLIAEERNVSEQAARVGQMIYLVAYAFGCELWAPWSEEFGRKPILQASLLCCNLIQILAACAPNFGSIIVARFLGGLFTANGGVTLAVVADMYEPDEHQFALAYMVLVSCFGITCGGFIGGFLQQRAPKAKWNFWTQMALNGAVQIAHFLIVPETRATILLDREARRRRRAGEQNIWGPNEAESDRLSPRRLLSYWIRPFQMLVYEPIVACCCALSGFSDMLIYIFQESYPLVFQTGWPGHKSWNFTTIEVGLCFLAVIVGYVIAYFIYLPRWSWEFKQRKSATGPDTLAPEARLFMLLFLAPWLPAGLFGFAWTSTGPPIHWIAPLIFSALISIANYSIYYGTIDYMIAASMFAVPMYNGMNGYQWSSTFLAFVAIIVVLPVYVFYFYGPEIRARSKFAQALAADRAANEGKNPDYDWAVEHNSIYNRSRPNSTANLASGPPTPGEGRA
ncbi:hypothetical protein KEM56_005858 [Ascosphaera pollenicola]|nr:hypothetical protein KEM56_005858 [Ascosphaera pollenicola]